MEYRRWLTCVAIFATAAFSNLGYADGPRWERISQQLMATDMRAADATLANLYGRIEQARLTTRPFLVKLTDANLRIRLATWSFDRSQLQRARMAQVVLIEALKSDGNSEVADGFMRARIAQMAGGELRNSRRADSFTLVSALWLYGKTVGNVARISEMAKPFVNHEHGAVRLTALQILMQIHGVDSTNIQVAIAHAIERSNRRLTELHEAVRAEALTAEAAEEFVLAEYEFRAKIMQIVALEIKEPMQILRITFVANAHFAGSKSQGTLVAFEALSARTVEAHKDHLLNDFVNVALADYEVFVRRTLAAGGRLSAREFKRFDFSDLISAELATLKLMRTKPGLTSKNIASVIMTWEDERLGLAEALASGRENYRNLLASLGLASVEYVDGSVNLAPTAANRDRLRTIFGEESGLVVTQIDRLFEASRLKAPRKAQECDHLLRGEVDKT